MKKEKRSAKFFKKNMKAFGESARITIELNFARVVNKAFGKNKKKIKKIF